LEINNSIQHCIYKIGLPVVNSRAVARFNFLRVDKFEARNRPYLHILALRQQGVNTLEISDFKIFISWLF